MELPSLWCIALSTDARSISNFFTRMSSALHFAISGLFFGRRCWSHNTECSRGRDRGWLTRKHLKSTYKENGGRSFVRWEQYIQNMERKNQWCNYGGSILTACSFDNSSISWACRGIRAQEEIGFSTIRILCETIENGVPYYCDTTTLETNGDRTSAMRKTFDSTIQSTNEESWSDSSLDSIKSYKRQSSIHYLKKKTVFPFLEPRSIEEMISSPIEEMISSPSSCHDTNAS